MFNKTKLYSLSQKPWLVGSIVFVLVFLTLAYSSTASFYHLKHELTTALKQHMVQIAERTAMDLDPKQMQQIVLAKNEKGSEYQNSLIPLQHTLRMDTLITFAYTMYLDKDSVRFGLDPTPPGDADQDGVDDHAYLGEAYAEVSYDARQSLIDGKSRAEHEFYTDKWGTFLSAYAPVLDSNSRVVAVVGVDLNTKSYEESISTASRRWIASLGASFVLAMIIGLLSFWASRMVLRSFQQARALSDLKGRFLVVLGHEMRTPLHGMIGTAQILEEQLKGQFVTETRTIIQVGHALDGLVSEVLEYASPKSQESTESAIDVHEFGQELLHALKHQLADLDRKIELEIDPTLNFRILMDVQRTLLVCLSLIDNALRYAPDADLGLRIYRKHHIIRFEIWDSGPGIPESKQKNLFDAFDIDENTLSRKNEGMGLGLHMCARRVRTMGGELAYADRSPNGAVFFWEIPLQRVMDTPVVQQDQPKDELSVLVVDDNGLNLKIASALLRKMGVDTRLCSSGADAIELLSHSPFDLVLMDIQMPLMDGLEATRRIRDVQGGYKGLIVALTANSLEEERQIYLQQGLDGVISKPLKDKTLEPWLQKARQGRPKKTWN